MLHVAVAFRGRTLLLFTLWPQQDPGPDAPEQRGVAMLAAGELGEPWIEFGLRGPGTR